MLQANLKSSIALLTTLFVGAATASSAFAGIVAVVNEEAAQQMSAQSAFSYRLEGTTPVISLKTDGFLFCGNAGTVPPASQTEVRTTHDNWRFGVTSFSGGAVRVSDVRSFSYGQGQSATARISSFAKDSSTPGSLVCLGADANGVRANRGVGMFDDDFEDPSAPVVGPNSSVSIQVGPRYTDLTENLIYLPYKITVSVPSLNAAAKLLLRDGYDSDYLAGDHVTWCYSDVDPGDMQSACQPGPKTLHTETVESNISVPAGTAKTWYFVVKRGVRKGSALPDGVPLVAAALFPDPAIVAEGQEVRLDDNLAFGILSSISH